MTTETALEFVERMERMLPVDIPHHQLQAEQDARRLLKLAKTAALIEEHKLRPQWSSRNRCWHVEAINGTTFHIAPDIQTAVRAVADRIKEQMKCS